MDATIWPVILSGGAGTRLWPLSRAQAPKQLLALTGDATMLQETLRRAPAPGFARPVIVCGRSHAAAIAAQCAAAGVTPAALIVEPAARNTAAAIALAALHVAARDPAAVLLVMPSDHVIADPDALRAAVARGRDAVADGWLATFGIAPTGPATGYGYIALGDEVSAGVHAARAFVEKPTRAAAEAMLAAGGHAWNGGLFLFAAAAVLDALRTHAPEILAAAEAALAGARHDGIEVHPDAAAFAAAPSISIDYAVMERAARVAVIPVDMGWSDIGAWDAVLEQGPADGDGNVLRGPVLTADTRGCLVRSEGPLVATLGVEGLIVVATGDAVLVAAASHAQGVKDIVARLPDPVLASRAVAEPVPGGTRHWLAGGAAGAVYEVRLAPGAPWDGGGDLLDGEIADGAAGPAGARLAVVQKLTAARA